MHCLCGGAGLTLPRKLPSLGRDLIRCRGCGKLGEPGLNSSPRTERRSVLQQHFLPGERSYDAGPVFRRRSVVTKALV